MTSAWTKREKNIRYSASRGTTRESVSLSRIGNVGAAREGQRSIKCREGVRLCTSVSWHGGLLDGETEDIMVVVVVVAAAAAATNGGACGNGFMVAPPLFSPE